MDIIAGISSGATNLKEPDHCKECGVELPEYWGEGFCSIQCYESEDE